MLVVVAAVVLVASCSSATTDPELDAALQRISDLEQELSDRNAELEQKLADATSTTTTIEATRQTITGTITLDVPDFQSPGDSCFGKGGYDDMRAGADVVVRDGTGSIIGTSSLKAGVVVRPSELLFRRCELGFAVEVPSDSDFYEIEVSHRGGLTYSNADMVGLEWMVAITLG